jgi:hypothetical protein
MRAIGSETKNNRYSERAHIELHKCVLAGCQRVAATDQNTQAGAGNPPGL